MSAPVAIITAASRGIGAGIARRLARDGWRLVLFSRSADVETLASELGATALRGDITRPDDLVELCRLALSTYGRVDAALISTGHPAKGDILQLSRDDWHAGLDLVLMPLLVLARELVPHFSERGAGVFLTVSSAAAINPHPDFPISSPMRAALANLTKLLAHQYGASGIRFNSVLPGFVDSKPATAERLARIPAGRYGTVEELAATVSFLLGPEAAYITGQSLLIDGGMTSGS
jgi:NAD(P)-dependent dehydrogenase (short-subunit alcohol dehydrogenase family)